MNRRNFITLLAAASVSSACRLPGDDSLFKPRAVAEQHWSLDLQVQEVLRDHIVAPLRSKVTKRYLHPNTDAACVLMSNETGDVLGYLGTIQDGSLFDCASHARNSGSACKPLLYAAALDTHSVTRDDTFMDAKMSFPCTECLNHEYSPDNYGGNYAGVPLTLTEALAHSSNVVMMQVVRRMNLSTLLPIIAALGLPAPTNYNTMALGWDVSPLALCAAMTALPNKGIAVRPRFIQQQRTNEKLEAVTPIRSSIFDSSVSRFIIEAMRACLTRGTGRAAADLATYMAGKTGSSDSAWAILCGRKVTAALWIGRRDTNFDIGYTGGTLAMPLLAEAIRTLKKSRPQLFPAWDA